MEQLLWIWYWVGGGFNSARVATREEALAYARQLGGTILKVDEDSLHVGTYAELDKLYKLHPMD